MNTTTFKLITHSGQVLADRQEALPHRIYNLVNPKVIQDYKTRTLSHKTLPLSLCIAFVIKSNNALQRIYENYKK